MKRLGDYIRPVDVRNRDLKVTKLLGVSISKEFMPSIANIIGTDMSNYKVVTKGQFAYGPVTSRNGDKISVALLDNFDEAIISQAYSVFEITNPDILDSEYLMMWFRRPEFDRYARFHSHGSAREVFDWDEMCEVRLPIPPIERQREAVAEYNAIGNRIAQNKRLIATLEETARAIYRRTFVEGIDPNNLPAGWRMGTLTEIAEYLNGQACQNYPASDNEAKIPVLKIRELTQGKCDLDSDSVTQSFPKKFIIENGDIIFSWSATLFIDVWAGGRCALNQHLFKVIPLEFFPKWFVYLNTQAHIEKWKHLISAKATSMGHIKREDLETAQVLIPSSNDMKAFDVQLKPLFDNYIIKKKETLLLEKILSLLLSKMGE